LTKEELEMKIRLKRKENMQVNSSLHPLYNNNMNNQSNDKDIESNQSNDKALSDKDIERVKAHTDLSTISLLSQDNVGGFQFFYGHEWIDVPYVEGALLVNSGEVLKIWSNERFKSTIHRVVNANNVKESRYSSVLFCMPNRSAPMNSKSDNSKSDNSKSVFNDYLPLE
jgi:isopenicillin N synthase-like dioxygenase